VNEKTRKPFPVGQVGAVLVLAYVGWAAVAMVRAFDQLQRDGHTDVAITPPSAMTWVFNVGLLMMLVGYVRAGRTGRRSRG
jgi:uncharacterized YccA/Bax inhibitor family protein